MAMTMSVDEDVVVVGAATTKASPTTDMVVLHKDDAHIAHVILHKITAGIQVELWVGSCHQQDDSNLGFRHCHAR